MSQTHSGKARLLSALVCCGLTFETLGSIVDIRMTGFPDGHLTDYDRATSVLYERLCDASLLFCLYFAVLTFAKTRRPFLWVAYGGLAYLLTIVLPAVLAKHYFLDWLHLDNGVGG